MKRILLLSPPIPAEDFARLERAASDAGATIVWSPSTQSHESLPPEHRAILRSVMLRLVGPSPEGGPVRFRIDGRTLRGDADHERIVALLVGARLVTTDAESVELAHEALARAWPRLQAWLDEDAAGQRTLRHLASTAVGWDHLGRPASELYRGARLEAALEWRDSASPDLTEVEVEFTPSGDGTLVRVQHRGWAGIRPDHPVRHGQPVPAFLRGIGLWWGELMTSLREHAAARPPAP